MSTTNAQHTMLHSIGTCSTATLNKVDGNRSSPSHSHRFVKSWPCIPFQLQRNDGAIICSIHPPSIAHTHCPHYRPGHCQSNPLMPPAAATAVAASITVGVRRHIACMPLPPLPPPFMTTASQHHSPHMQGLCSWPLGCCLPWHLPHHTPISGCG